MTNSEISTQAAEKRTELSQQVQKKVCWMVGTTWRTWIIWIERLKLGAMGTQEALIRLKLNYNIDPFDCLIAATSYRLQTPLYTRNLKHFRPLLRSLTQRPY